MSPVANHNQHLLLDSVVGWRELVSTGLTLTKPDGYYTLDPIPGPAQLFQQSSPDAAAELGCPSSLTKASGGQLFAADAAYDVIADFDLASGRPQVLKGFGGRGSQPRQLNAPRGIAALPSGAISVADTGNHRVQIFSAAPYVLLAVWGRRDTKPGSGQMEFRWPWGIAVDGRGTVYVADRGNRRVQVIGSNGDWLGELGAGVLADPTEIAVDPNGLVAVLDAASDPKRTAIFLFPPGGAVARTLDSDAPRSLAFDSEGNLFIGNASGIVYKFGPDRKSPGGFRVEGAGMTGVDGAIQHLAWTADLGLLAIIRETSNNGRQRIWRVDPSGAHAGSGVFISCAIDSGIENCAWHRVTMCADVPQGTSVQVESLTSEVAPGKQDPGTFAGGVPCLVAGYNDPECLVQSPPGRYLALRLTLRSDGRQSPIVKAIRIYYPRQSYLQYLPAVYQQDDESRRFLERFLAIFQSSFDAFDQRIDTLWQLLDPLAVPEKWLSWLAAWLALPLDPTWPIAKRRAMLKNAIHAYRRRGTPGGIEQAIYDYAGVGATIIEHFRLSQWPALCFALQLGRNGSPLWSRDFYARLQVNDHSVIGSFRLTDRSEPGLHPVDWGAHRFSVFFRANPYDSQSIEVRVRQVVEAEKPAHTIATLCPVYPRMRVGVQATLGIDTVVGEVSNLVLSRLATLGYDSILSCSDKEHKVRLLGATTRPRAGMSARLL